MNLYELMSGNLQTAQNSSVFQFGAQPDRITSGGRDTSSFRAMLDTKLSSADRQTGTSSGRNTAPVRKSSGEGSAKTENKPKYLTFQEANANVRKPKESQIKAKAADMASEPEKTTDDGREDRKKNIKADMQENFMDICAQLLGIDKGELQKLLDKAGISADSLKDAAGVRQAAADLSQLLGLNSGQAGTLEKLLAAAAESLGLIEAVRTNDTKGAADGQAEDALQAEASKLTDIRSTSKNNLAEEAKPESGNTPADNVLTDKLAALISDKLDQISEKARMDNSTEEDELKSLMKPLLEKAGVMAKAVQQETRKTDAEIQPADTDNTTQAQVAGASEKAPEKGSDESGDKGNNEADADSGTAQKAAVSQPVQAVKTAPDQAQYRVVQDAKQVFAAAAEKAPEAPVKPRELVSQIIEKAKVVLSPDKSEMVIDLKPDSLGKLSLKVVTENGIVMAKFIADNQQVREILESNMQFLKDSLEKQGMNVQGFSVSVRQDQRGTDTNRPQYGTSGNPAARPVRNIPGLQGHMSGLLEANTARNPYRWEDSTIDLTA